MYKKTHVGFFSFFILGNFTFFVNVDEMKKEKTWVFLDTKYSKF